MARILTSICLEVKSAGSPFWGVLNRHIVHMHIPEHDRYKLRKELAALKDNWVNSGVFRSDSQYRFRDFDHPSYTDSVAIKTKEFGIKLNPRPPALILVSLPKPKLKRPVLHVAPKAKTPKVKTPKKSSAKSKKSKLN